MVSAIDPKRLIAKVRDHSELAALAVIVTIIPLLPGTVPGGILGLGIVSGAALALQAVALVLIFRANRIVNFAQAHFGTVAAMMFALLVEYRPLLRWLGGICPPCGRNPGRGLELANYFVSLVLSLGFAVLLAWLTYAVVMRRFTHAPRLVATVATVFVVGLLAGVQSALPNLLTTPEQREAGLRLEAARLPFELSFTWSPARFHIEDILTVLAAAALSVWLFRFFRRSRTGIAIRASADSSARAETLGINVSRVTGRVWVIAGVLSGVSALLRVMSTGPGLAELDLRATMHVLAVAVIARMFSIPAALISAVAFGMLIQAVLWSTGSTLLLDAFVPVLIGTLLLVQRHGGTRVDAEQGPSWRPAREVRPIPQQLRSLPVVRKWRRIAIVSTTVVVAFAPWAMSPSQNNLSSGVMLHAMVALSLLVLTGWAGQISLGQIALAAVGAYIAASLPIPLPITLILAAAAGALVALVLGLPALRARGLHLAIITLAFAVAVPALLLGSGPLASGLPSSVERPQILGMSLEDERTFYYFTLAILVMVIAAVVGMRRSAMARALIAARDNESAAQAFGVNIVRARLQAFAVAGAIAAFAGALMTMHQHGAQAASFAPERSLLIFQMAVIGGLGSVVGPLVGALYYAVIELDLLPPIMVLLVTGGGGLGFLLFFPGGLAQVLFEWRDAVLRQIARKRRLIVPSLLEDRRTLAHGGKVPIAPPLRAGGGTAFVPSRYEVDGQWAQRGTTAPVDASRSGGKGVPVT